LADGIHEHAGDERRREAREEIDRLPRKTDPLSAKPNAAVPRTIAQVVAEQRPNVRHHGRRTYGMQPMTAEVHRDAVDLEAAGVATDSRPTLQDGDTLPPSLRQLQRRSETSRPGPQDCE